MGGLDPGLTPISVDYVDGLDPDLDFSQASLPHIPLRPFRNQVGGHSAIYKFTKGAVCKVRFIMTLFFRVVCTGSHRNTTFTFFFQPLVSRENLFYESVEREAPPLLGFIPRYLGVMLVSYRRVPKGSTTPPSASTTPKSRHVEGPVLRPPMHKYVTAPPRAPEYSHAHLANADMPDSVTEENEGDDTDPAEAEMPEVALDHNRHIIPEWMLRGGMRNRSLSSSYASGTPQLRQIKRMHLDDAMASSPDLALPMNRRTTSAGNTSTQKFNRLARQFAAAHVIGAPTPANSPSASLRILPGAKKPSSRQFFLQSTSDDEGTSSRSRPTVQPLQSERSIRTSQSPVWFGGTGSTVVNTKLKDHVFSTVLRRLRKHTGGRCTGVRTEDEGKLQMPKVMVHVQETGRRDHDEEKGR